jgi:hypothetical protein
MDRNNFNVGNNDCCLGPQSHKIGAFRDDEYVIMIITPCGLVALILGRFELTVSVGGIKCKSVKVVACIEAVAGNNDNSA